MSALRGLQGKSFVGGDLPQAKPHERVDHRVEKPLAAGRGDVAGVLRDQAELGRAVGSARRRAYWFHTLR
jgi:hypothetical protein